MSIQTTSVNFSLSESEIPKEEWWLRMEEPVATDIATVADAAEIIDSLYDLDPCFGQNVQNENGTVPPEEPTKDKLKQVARAKVDIAECARMRMGDYTKIIHIYKSHPPLPYKLRVDVGEIKSTTTTYKDIAKTIAVKDVSFIRLDMPVVSGLVASWAGSVVDSTGTINPPVLKLVYGNTIFWNKTVTGTLKIQYRTIFDIVTIFVPGIPNYVGSPNGKPQECNILAFYHFQTFKLTINAPDKDSKADEAKLAEICGWYESGTPDSDDEPEPDTPEPEDGPELGCLEYSQTLADPAYYEEKCCVPPPFGLPDCKRYAVPKPLNGMDPLDVAKYSAGHNGPVEFIGIGPGPEGCGRLIYSQKVKPKACCDEIVPMSPHPDNPTSISLGQTIVLRVLDGVPNLYWEWKASGGLLFVNGQSTIITGNAASVYAPLEGVCGNASIQIEDGCDRLHIPLDVPTTSLVISPVGAPISPNTWIGLSVAGGAGPFIWALEQGLSLVSGQGTRNILIWTTEEFCGSSAASVVDGCGDGDSINIQSTEGYFIQIFWPDYCQLPPGVPSMGQSPDDPLPELCGVYGPNTVLTIGKWRMYFQSTAVGFTLGLTCPEKDQCGWNMFSAVNEWHCLRYTCFGAHTWDDTYCCHMETSPGQFQSMLAYQTLTQVFEWQC